MRLFLKAKLTSNQSQSKEEVEKNGLIIKAAVSMVHHP